MRDELYCIDNVTFKGRKMLIPKRLRGKVLEGLHAAHQGEVSMKFNARERLFWPGLDSDISLKRKQCQSCNENAPSQAAESLVMTPTPDSPFEKKVTDLCEINGYSYLVYADRYSGWAEVTKLKCSKFDTVQRHLMSWFTTFGIPDEISSDGGPPFNSSKYDNFCKSWGIKKRLSSAHYSQSNGRAEAAVKSMKRILRGNLNSLTGEVDTHKAACAIMTHRNTPSRDTGLSPAEMIYGHRIRDHIPNKFRSRREEWIKIPQNIDRTSPTENKQESRRLLPPLSEGDRVMVQNQIGNKPKRWSKTGTILEVMPHRQYKVRLDGSSRVTLRNRRFLRKITPANPNRTSLWKHKNITNTNLPYSKPSHKRFSTYRPPRKPETIIDEHPKYKSLAPQPIAMPPMEHASPMEPQSPTVNMPPATRTNIADITPQSTTYPPASPIPEIVHSPRRSNRQRTQVKRLIEEM